MPPPTAAEKERTAQLVASLPRKEQAELLAQALLREYMHRRGFTSTLAAFDQENPRDERAIASRAIMKRLLNIPVEGRPSRLQPAPEPSGKKAAQKKTTAAPTFMEEMCSYRLTKRDYALQTKAAHRKASDITTDDLAQKEGEEEPLDPSDAEMASLSASVAAHKAAEREAMARAKRFAVLQREKAAAEAAVAAAEASGSRGDGNATASSGEDDTASEGSRSESTETRRRRRKERRHKEHHREKKRKGKKGKRSHKSAGGDGAAAAAEEEAEEGADSAEEAYLFGAAPSPAAAGAAVGSRWAPPGLANTAGAGHDKNRDGSHFDPFAPFGSGGHSRLGTAHAGDDGGFLAPSTASAAALPERPVFDAGAGMTLMGATASATAAAGGAAGHSPGTSPSPATSTALGGGIGASGGSGGGRPLLNRHEITEAWQPGGAKRDAGGSGLSPLAGVRGPGTGMGRSALSASSTAAGAGGGGSSSLFLASPARGGSGGLSQVEGGAGAVSPDSSQGRTPPRGQFAYDRAAQPLTSALASSGKFSGGAAAGKASAPGGGGGGSAKRVGVGFGMAPPSAPSAMALSSSFAPSTAGSGGGGPRAAPPSSTGQPVFRSAADAVPGSDGLRHGFGFHKSPAGDASGGAGGAGGKKNRKVTLLVD